MTETELKVIYFAHPIPTYGSEREEKALALLEARFPESYINNPAKLPGRNMQYFLNEVKTSDMVVFMTKENRIIGRGVYREVTYAERLGKPVVFLDPITKRFYPKYQLRIIDENNWKEYATGDPLP